MIRKTIIAAIAVIFSIASLSAQQIVAHRGYHAASGAPENSIASLHAAHIAGIEVVEFDVVFTADNYAVVAHGPNHPQFGGVPIAKSTLEDLRATPLSNGELLPTLDEYLETASKYDDLEFFLEIKLLGDEDLMRVWTTIIATVDRYQLNDRLTYICFDKEMCDIAASRGAMYLGGDMRPKRALKRGYEGISYSVKVLGENKRWIKKAHKLGLEVNIWTVNRKSDARWAIRNDIDYITTDKPELVRKYIDKRDKRELKKVRRELNKENRKLEREIKREHRDNRE